MWGLWPPKKPDRKEIKNIRFGRLEIEWKLTCTTLKDGRKVFKEIKKRPKHLAKRPEPVSKRPEPVSKIKSTADSDPPFVGLLMGFSGLALWVSKCFDS